MTIDATPDPTGGTLGPVLNLLNFSDRTNRRLQTVLVTYTLSNLLATIIRKRVNTLRAEAEYQVAVTGSDNIYPDVHRWLLESLPPHRRRALTARSGQSDQPVDVSNGNGPIRELRLYYDSTRTQTVDIEGHRIRVVLERPEWAKQNLDDAPRYLANLERIIFIARNIDGREAILRFLQDIVNRQEHRTPRTYIAGRWGGWSRRGDSPPRPLRSVILRSGQRETIVADLDQFLHAETDYIRLGVPYHRGYLLEGPPGVGKTSLARALAGHFALDMYYIPLPSIPNDGVLIELLAGVEARSVLLLEDVDTVTASHDRDGVSETPKEGVTLAGLLNGLDGLVTPHGLITILTTNNADILDHALIRPGRVDRREHLGLLDNDQFARLAAELLGRPVELPELNRASPPSPAEAIEIVKRNLDDPETALIHLKELARR